MSVINFKVVTNRKFYKDSIHSICKENKMSKYQRIELSDLVNNPNLKGAQVEVTGIISGVQEGSKGFEWGIIYTAFLEYKLNSLLLLEGNCKNDISHLRELSMLKTSSESERLISIQGKVQGEHPQYRLNVSGVKLEKYTSILYKD